MILQYKVTYLASVQVKIFVTYVIISRRLSCITLLLLFSSWKQAALKIFSKTGLIFDSCETPLKFN